MRIWNLLAGDWSKRRRLLRGSNGRLRPLKRCEEAQAPSPGKRSHLRKSTAVSCRKKTRTFERIGSRFLLILLLQRLDNRLLDQQI